MQQSVSEICQKSVLHNRKLWVIVRIPIVKQVIGQTLQAKVCDIGPDGHMFFREYAVTHVVLNISCPSFRLYL